MELESDRPGPADAKDRKVSLDSSWSKQRSPLTMAMLFYVVTVSGIISACLRTLVGNQAVTTQSMTVVLLAGIVIGLIGGGLIGLVYFKTIKAGFIASSMGILVGGLAGGLALVDGKYFMEVTFIAFGGSWMLILIMLLSARFRQDATIASPDSDAVSATDTAHKLDFPGP